MAELPELQGPYEILDLPDRGSIRLRVRGWIHGRVTIHPKYPGAPEEKEVEALRLQLVEGYKATPPHYYDVTAKTLIYQLLPVLQRPDYSSFELGITKYGVAPRARFTVEVTPIAKT